jgi:hypothetical protein
MRPLKSFLRDHGLSRSTWFRMADKPKVVRIGKKIYIRAVDEATWRAKLERVATR